MTSEDENEYHQHLQVHSHSALNSLSSASSCTSISQQHHQQQHQHQQQQSNRRRSSYSQNHFPQQLSSQTINFKDIIDRSVCTNVIISNGQSNDNLCSQLNNSNNNNTNNYNSTLSPNRYMSNGEYNLGSRLSTVSQERYDENITCCLPPPSPAPNNDRFIMGIPSPSALHYQDSRLSVHNRTMSPSSKYRNGLSDRYREASPKCERFIPPPAHFLANSTPMASTDNYAYISSTAHTPVKRYIPTPPPQTETYDNGYIQQQQMSRSHSSQSQQHQQNQQQQQQNTLPYRFRMKCCQNEQTIVSNNGKQLTDITDHYATPPRVRPIKCSTVSTSSNTTTTVSVPSQTSSSSSSSSSSSTNHNRQSRQMCNNNGITINQDFNQRSQSNLDYNNVGRVSTPINNMVNDSASMSSTNSNSNACLHCNTIRRTTGVHQTTQTTGPISPIPQQLSNCDLSDRQSPISPPSSSSSLSTISSPLTQPQAHNQTQQPTVQSPSQMHHQLNHDTTSTSNYYSQQQHQQIILKYQSQQQLQSQNKTIDIKPTLTKNNNSSSSLNSSSNLILQQVPAPQQLPSSPMPQQPSPTQPIPRQNSSNLSGNICNNNTINSNHIATQQRMTRKQRFKEYLKKETAKFFGVDTTSEEQERLKWNERQKRFALRRFGQLKDDNDIINNINTQTPQQRREQQGDRPDILPAQSTDETATRRRLNHEQLLNQYKIERKSSVPTMMWNGLTYIVQTLSKKRLHKCKQWSRSFAPSLVTLNDNDIDACDGLTPINDDEAFFESTNSLPNANGVLNNANVTNTNSSNTRQTIDNNNRQMYMAGERMVNGWRTKSAELHLQQQQGSGGYRSNMRMSSQLLDGVIDNSRRPITNDLNLLRPNVLDDRYDYRPFFTYWINTVQILVLFISIICYGIGPIGIGVEQKSGQVLVTSLSLQQVQHLEQRNVWIGPKNIDLVHLGAKFSACMRRDIKILDVISKTRRQERETACCIRNDDSGCVQSSQADCSVRGLWPTKTISTWKKWSPGDSGPGGRISGSVCGLDPKYCDAPASVAPFEWPDDITKWPICRKTNSFSQRFRFKDHTAEHMVCEVIGHPCCTGVYGECRITTREYCDFVNGYFHEEASLCSQVSCLNDICGMFPFISSDIPDQFYRLFTSLCLHAGILHLAITVAFQHILLSDLERLLGPIRTSIVYVGSGIAGNLTSAIFVPYKPEIGPLASLAGIISSFSVLLILCHWKKLKKPHIALIKLILITGTFFGVATLPWQQNFTSLVAGLIFGTALTLALVPFINVTKYNRKSKINLIWTCLLLHLVIYIAMFIIFFLFPTLFSSFPGFHNGLDGAPTNDEMMIIPIITI